MNRRKFLVSVSTLSLILLAGCTPKEKEVEQSTFFSGSSHENEKGYWTCTMHPQVHKNESGKCPICGMPLIYVDNKIHTQKVESAGIETTDEQIKNANVAKYKLVKKDLVLTIATSGRLVSAREVAFQVYESDIAFIKPGLSVSGFASINPNTLIKGRVSSIDNMVDPSSRTVRVTVLLDSSVTNFVAETSFHGQIQNIIKDQIIVPEEAVLHAGKRDLVYVFKTETRLEPREVLLGKKSKFEYQILSGLAEGEVISAGANFLVDSETKIRGQ